MTFKEQINDDLEKVFLDPDYFATKVTLNGVSINVIFDENYAVIDEMEVTAYQPAFTCLSNISQSFKRGDIFVNEEKSYVIAEVDRSEHLSTFMLESR